MDLTLGGGAFKVLVLHRHCYGAVDEEHRVQTEFRAEADRELITISRSKADAVGFAAGYSWEAKSCSGMKLYGRDGGSVIMGETGSVVLDAGGYEVYNRKGNKTGEFKEGTAAASSDPTGEGKMTDLHFANFIAGNSDRRKTYSADRVGHVTVTMLQLSNIAREVQRELKLNPKNGHILDDPEAMKSWSRKYEPGWAPKV